MASVSVRRLSAPDTIMVNVWFKMQHASYQLQSCSTVGELRQRVASDHAVSPAEMKILLGGCLLDDQLTIRDSGVGMESTLFAIQRKSPPTAVTTLPTTTSTTTAAQPPPSSTTMTTTTTVTASDVDSHPSSTEAGMAAPSSSVPSPENQDGGGQRLSDQYFVYCKVCQQIRAGRLRVKCSVCDGGAVLLDKGPDSWEDVLMAGRLTGTCQTLQCEACQPIFYFKCAEQHSGSVGSTVVALRHIMPNRRSVPCITCEDVMNPVVVFPCEWSHVMCLACFGTYCSVRLKERGFRHTTQYGYTLPCPAGCGQSCIQEQHHFCVLSGGGYECYKDFAAEEYLLAEGGLFCPRPECGSGFLLDSAAHDRCITCPHCKFVFCRHCQREEHEGDCLLVATPTSHPQDFSDAERARRARWEEQTADTIQQTTRACPGCGTRTERDGGCMHMRCARCGEDWCWLCIQTWDRDCQGAHWFG
ncbi:hypothetical protein ACOMHN_043174 [Nucella lapillus]